MHRLVSRKSAFAILASLLIVPGCGDNVDTTTVSGNVSYLGQPLANGFVTFFPQRGHPVNAAIDSAGAYTAELPAGEYRVAIEAPGEQYPEGWKEGDPPPPPPKLVLPPEYSTRAKTTLSVSVAEGGGPQSKDFELK
jgi:hypothetical protein